MRLRTLDCKSCAAPLRQEGDKLVCKFCGSVFDIPRDANDIEYDRVVKAEDYIRLSLAKSLLNLENSYKTKEEINREKRANDLRARQERTIKTVIKSLIPIAVILTITFFICILVVMRPGGTQKTPVESETAVWDPGYRITPGDLKADKKFKKYIQEGIVSEVKQGYDDYGAVIFGSDEIWCAEKDPEILGRYLITEEDSNSLYIVFRVTFETGDGRVRDMYTIRGCDNIKVGKDGKIVYGTFDGRSTDYYDFRFHSDPDLDQLMEQYVYVNKSDLDRYFFEF